MLFDRYANESDFRSAFLRPLLARLGFLSVAELHGTQEFGKDFVFPEITPFGFLRHYAAVVKHEKRISQASHALLTEILAQIRQAFSVVFRLPDYDAENTVSALLSSVSGSITHNACEWLRSELRRRDLGKMFTYSMVNGSISWTYLLLIASNSFSFRGSPDSGRIWSLI